MANRRICRTVCKAHNKRFRTPLRRGFYFNSVFLPQRYTESFQKGTRSIVTLLATPFIPLSPLFLLWTMIHDLINWSGLPQRDTEDFHRNTRSIVKLLIALPVLHLQPRKPSSINHTLLLHPLQYFVKITPITLWLHFLNYKLWCMNHDLLTMPHELLLLKLIIAPSNYSLFLFI